MVYASWKMALVDVGGLVILYAFVTFSESKKVARKEKYDKMKEKLFRMVDK